MENSLEDTIKSLALAQGFDLCGIASLQAPPSTLGRLTEWLERGYSGEMAYLERQREKRLDPSLILPGARSMICLGLLYNTPHPYSIDVRQPWISRYAWGEDYHEVMKCKLNALEQALRQTISGDYELRSYCDTGPIAEKAWAAAAGLGWLGKNTMLINRKLGSWLFLGEILTTLQLTPDQPAPDLCGTCTRCLEACPTQAFPEPYVLDARRCVSYLTIEKRGEIPEQLRDGVGLNVYGCDICQDVCPWNRMRITGREAAFEPRPGLLPVNPEELASLDDQAFASRFKNSAMRRVKAAGLRRNAQIVLENQKK